eukprot:TRINITY_DN11044_c0_g2_i1.p1 TRINITY_DN11044_c0_g2~~TRINITY_DN11044_c0_g2_i1.p1  ORF type:complete len:160 (-),score=33.64 TRINITY_DN11044_c0_g2_i1:79-558(-)
MRGCLCEREWWNEGLELQMDVERMVAEVYLDFVWCCPHDTQVLVELGRISAAIGRWESAVGFLQEAVGIEGAATPLGVSVTCMMARCYLGLNKLDKARRCYMQALRLMPDHPGCEQHLEVLAEMEKHPGACYPNSGKTRGKFPSMVTGELGHDRASRDS